MFQNSTNIGTTQTLNKSNMKHISYFSQTGSEIADIAEALGHWPDKIVTNQRPISLRVLDKRVVASGKLVILPNTPTAKDYIMGDLVTLHGWLRIVPPSICQIGNIYNGHPGLIDEYQCLKGKDPQVKAWNYIKNGHMKEAGSVIHKVTAGVDEGEILEVSRFKTEGIKDLDQLYNTLKDTSLNLWIKFFKSYLEY